MTKDLRPTLTSPVVLTAATVLALAGLAGWNRARARKAERAHPPRGRVITVGAARVHYVDRGAGAPVLLLHGNTVTNEDFALCGLTDLLVTRGFRVIAIDRPGFGHSSRPRGHAWTAEEQAALVCEVLAVLGVAQPIVVGHSWGAIVALALALNHPGTARGLVLVSGYYYPTLRVDGALAAIGALPILGDLLNHTVSPLVGRALMPLMLKLMFGPRAAPATFAHGFIRDFAVRPSQLRAETGDGSSMAEAASAMADRYDAISVPVAILAGAQDRVVGTRGQPARLHDAIAQSSFELVPDAGHMLHHAVPERVAAAVDRVAAQAAPLPPEAEAAAMRA